MRPCSEEELDALMSALAWGDRAAFEPLFRELHPRALRLARARLSPAVAEDAAQSALLKVFARASEFSPGRAALPWFYAVCANEVRSFGRKEGWLKRGSPSASASDALEAASEADSAEDALMRRELEVALERAVAELDELSAAAISAVLGRGPRPDLPAATFRKRLSRAYDRLRATFRGGELEH